MVINRKDGNFEGDLFEPRRRHGVQFQNDNAARRDDIKAHETDSEEHEG